MRKFYKQFDWGQKRLGVANRVPLQKQELTFEETLDSVNMGVQKWEARAAKLGAKSILGKEYVVDCNAELPDLTFTLSGKDITIGNLKLKDCTFVEVDKTSGLGSGRRLGKFDGILGLGWDSISIAHVPTPWWRRDLNQR